MTKKDYEAFAAMIKDNFLGEKNYYDSDPEDPYGDGKIVGYNWALEDMALDMCKIFAEDNERFDKKKFLEACGL